MTIRFGANPIGWSNDDMRELGGDIPIEQCLSEARTAGFEGMEMGHKFPTEASALRKVLSAHSLDLVSGWYSAELMRRTAAEEMERLRPHLDLLKALGANVLIFAETTGTDHTQPQSRRPTVKDGQWPELGKRLTEIADRTLAEGVRLVFHHHMGTPVQSEADIDAMMAATGPSFNLLLDTGHATWGGADPARLARRYRDRIGHFHAKDVRKAVMERSIAEDWNFQKSVVEGVYTVPGDGAIDFVAVMKELPGYSGWMIVEAEQDPKKAHPLTYAKMGYANLRRFAAEAGLIPA
jgi:inosose dehydratase/3D-(3,5/4)-trihydroxycyclohexane-1,2-dione acylhydrolase (decyclizing)